MKRIHIDTAVPNYPSGKWTWDEAGDCLKFVSHSELGEAGERYIDTNGYKFLRTIDQHEETVFRQVYVRPGARYDLDTIGLHDVRDLVLFMMPKEFLTLKFVAFIHQPDVHRLLHSLILYFNYFLQLVEFILIRRDELSGNKAQVQSEQTNEVKRIWSTYLGQYRLLVARNYSVILKSEGDLKKYYHTKEIVHISSKIKDRAFHSQFLAYATQVVWITLHRRAYFIIEMEMNRLFRSEYFLMNRKEYPEFTPVERSLLYGRNCKIVNYREQRSPLIQELLHVADEDMPILWIGERMYRGSDHRIAELELEYMVPDMQLYMVDISHGILGHPKTLYNTILALDWPSVRYSNFSLNYDPYYMIRQPELHIPNINDMALRRMSKNLEHYYKIFRIYEQASKAVLMNWVNRVKVLDYYHTGGVLHTLERSCELQLKSDTRQVHEIVEQFKDTMGRLRKKKVKTMGDVDQTNAAPDEKPDYVLKGDDVYFAE
ncbi:hypothetical protein AWZ03_002894 [Drosophila navojoa]|uniref:Uncharacterized protein n=1 Tax=Drosophila navojoa TaxID=7232 RepID=A0A484BRA2_DRONA|nr:uncharacterized protein LOC108654350 [Drosophila navojoa]TDG50590.1 hypothetical protein AWZ03_002894 [Drosophila navojoa]